MFRVSYRAYIHSDEWRCKADACKYRANYRCQCFYNGKRCDQPATEVHHKHYRTLGHEQPQDLLAVCSDCHRVIHGLPRRAANDNQLTLPLVSPTAKN